MNLFWNPSREDVSQEFSELKKSSIDRFFQIALEKLEKKITEVPDRSPELALISQQIEELHELNRLYREEYSQPMTSEGNKEIGDKFHLVLQKIQNWESLESTREEIEALIDGELDRLADTINPFSERSVRDIVERNINISGTIGETWWESEVWEKFLKAFTIAYINVIGKESASYDWESLQCDEGHIIGILSWIKSKFSLDEVWELGKISFTTAFWEVTYALNDVLEYKESYTEEEILEALQKKQTSYEFAAKYIEVSKLLDLYITWFLPQKKDSFQKFVQKPEVLSQLSFSQVIDLFQNDYISREIAWNTLEWSDGFQENKNEAFSLSDAIDIFGFSQDFEKKLSLIFWRKLDETELLNLKKMIQFFLFIESNGNYHQTTGGYNVANYAGVSSAEGYLQYLTQNGWYLRQVYDNENDVWRNSDREVDESKIRVRRFRWNNSYETALQSLPQEILTSDEVFYQEFQKIGHPKLQSPMKLSAERQMILFLADIYNKGKEKWLDIDQILFKNIWELNDIFDITSLYSKIHHTDINPNTAQLMKKAITRVWRFSEAEVESILFIVPIPKPRPKKDS